MIVFSDFQCPFCRRFARDVIPALANDYVRPGYVTIGFRHVPIEARHPFAMGAARAAECAREQDRFWAMHDFLFSRPDALVPGAAVAASGGLGLDSRQFSVCLDRAADSVILDDLKLARSLGVLATPTVAATVASRGWAVHSILHAGRDLADVPLDVREGDALGDIVVTVSDQMSTVSGLLIDSTGRPTPELYVFMFPVDRASWTRDSRRIRAVRADTTGTYSVTGLPAGAYYLSATTTIDATRQYDASYLELFVPAAIRMTLGDGEQRKQDLRVGG